MMKLREKGEKKKLKKSPKQAWGLTDIVATKDVAFFIRMTEMNIQYRTRNVEYRSEGRNRGLVD